MVCYLNIGNTHTQILTVSGNGERTLKTVPTDDFNLELLPKDATIIVASVVTAWQQELIDADALFLNYTMTNLDFSYCDPKTIGADRLANANKLAHDGILPAATIDFGTAITVEIVDENKCFRGGIIAPGRILMRHALHAYTSKLPEIPLSKDSPDFPGTNTRDAMRNGTDGVAIDFVKGFLVRIRDMFPNTAVRIVACGGDRHYFLNALEGMEDGGDFFTLDGLSYIGLPKERN